MFSFHIDEWLPAEQVACPELSATWARLSILADSEPISEVYDREAGSVRTGLYVPLYPLAEWITTRWFFLLWETEVPGKRDSREFRRRHALRTASEGFALPDLEILSEGRVVRVAWKPVDLPLFDLRFMASGEARYRHEDLERSLREFVERVIRRLEDRLPGVKTFLQEEWENLQLLGREEFDFCRTAASMGLDPFSLADAQEDEIVRVYDALPAALREDFFRVAAPETLEGHLGWVQEGLSRARSRCQAASVLPPLRQFADSSFPAASGRTPWEHGYACARALRRHLDLDGQPLVDGTYSELLGFGMAESLPAPHVHFDGLTVRDECTQSGTIVLSGRLAVSKRFAYGRSLFEYLTSQASQSLITRAVTHDQQRNRAFAAELLAPSESIRERLTGTSVSQEQLEELAEVFGVSPYVIEHQVENHGLGSVARA